MNKSFDEITDEILNELLEEERQENIRKVEIIKNGCPHINKIKHTGIFSGIDFLYCDVCYKQFDLKGNRIE